MKLQAILSEAWRNTRSGANRAAVWAAVLAVISGVLALAEVSLISSIQHDARAFHEAAADVKAVVAEARIDGIACANLELADSVEDAGALSEGLSIKLAATPESQLAAFRVTSSFGRLIGLNDVESTGIWVEEELAEVYGFTVGMLVLTTQGSVRITGIYHWPSDGRDARLGFAVLIPDLSSAQFDECWIRTPNGSEVNDGLLQSVEIFQPNNYSPTQVTQINKSHGATLDVDMLFKRRLSRYGIWGGMLAGLIVGVASSRRRRLEQAAALHAGQHRTALVVSIGIESILWSMVAGTVVIAASGIAAWLWSLDSWLLLWWHGAKIAVGASAATIVGAMLGAIVVKEKHLFEYFKRR